MSDFKFAPKQENKNFPTAEKFSMTEKVQYAQGSVVSKIIIRNERGNVTLFAFDKGEFLSEHTRIRNLPLPQPQPLHSHNFVSGLCSYIC